MAGGTQCGNYRQILGKRWWKSSPMRAERKKDTGVGESEVRYEVYYPAPASSSIAHNPKYIRQDTDLANSNDHMQHSRSKKQHRGKQRNRMTLKDVDDWELAACHTTEPHRSLTMISHMVNPDELSLLRNTREEHNTSEYLLSSLIEKAQRLQNFKGTTAKPYRKKNRIRVKEDNKSHIVYMDKAQQHSVQNQKSHVRSEETTAQAVSPMPSEFTRVLLPKNDAGLQRLKECFRECYTEVSCKPRRFLLDITSSMRDLLKKVGIHAKIAEQTEEAQTYLICVYDGFFNDEYDVYRVLLNSKLHKGLLSVDVGSRGQHDLFTGTVMNLISLTMDFMLGMVTSLRDNKHFPLFIPDQMAEVSRHLSNHLGSSEVYVPSVKRMLQSGCALCDVITMPTMPTLSDLVQEEAVFCDVCYEDISPLTYESSPYTSLLDCQHSICNSCWSQHIHIRFNEGFARFTCPGYDCQQEVKLEVMLSLVPVDTVEKLLQRQEEVRIGASQTEKWCPNELCGRVISLKVPSSCGSLQFQQDVVCACGAHICFQCLLPAHWPASCQQAEDYRATAATAVFPDRLAEIHDDFIVDRVRRQMQKEKKSMIVEGKHCPRCKNFVFKDGGCSQMTCRCGQLFCWHCTRPGGAHYGCVSEKREKDLTTTVVVHHLRHEIKPDDMKQQQQQTTGNRRQRTSLMERAVEHRKHREKNWNHHAITTLAKAVASGAAKNKALTQQLVKMCSSAFPAPCASVTVLEMTLTFLKSADHRRQELLQVVEYSLVLLKDLPDSLLRRRALRISEDLSAFCSFSQSVFDVWDRARASQAPLQEAVKALMRLAEIQDWINSALDTQVITVKKLRDLKSPGQ